MEMNKNVSGQSTAFSRAINAIFVERRLPYAIEEPLNRLCKKIGLRYATVRTEDGLRFRVRRLTSDVNFIHNVVKSQEYTPERFKIQPADTVIDIGGNIGTFSILAAKAAHRGRVFTYEPGSENFKLLQQNIKANGVTNVVATHAAVADSDGTIELDLCDGDGGYNSTIRGRLQGVKAKEVVRAISLQRIFDDNGITQCDFMKMDCEGAEYAIVRSLPLEYWRRVSRIALEYHGTELGELRRNVKELVARLEEAGLKVEHTEEHTEFLCGHVRARRT
jgi:FkbM family methyltransferase